MGIFCLSLCLYGISKHSQVQPIRAQYLDRSGPMRVLHSDCRCKLELWDDDSGLAENPERPDLVIDQTSRLNLGRNKYVDSLGDEDEYEHMDEKISAYR